MYEVILSKKAEKQFKKLDRDLQKRIRNSLKRIRVRPHEHLRRLIGNPNYSLRVGKHRIIVRVEEGKLLVLVLEIGHRRNVYKKLK